MKTLWLSAILFGLGTPVFAQEEVPATSVEKDEKSEESVLVDGDDFKIYWKNGTHIESSDGTFKLKFGGRIHNDWAFISADDDMKAATFPGENGTEFRRSRLFFGGTLWDRVIFKMQYDFATGDTDFKDVYVGIKGLPVVGTLTVGQQFELFGFTAPISNYNTFIEGALDSSISPQRSTGFRFHNQAFENRLQWSLGYFWGGSDSYGDDKDNDGVNVITGRITGLPIYQEGDMLLHVGMSFSNRHLRGDATEFKSKPMANLAEEYVLTSTSPDDLLLVGFELGFAWQSLHAQLEYVHYDVSAIDGASDATFSGWYLQFGYFLTGETRPYSGKNGMWSRVTPLKNAFGEEGGYGAWEAKARIQMIDGNDDDVTGNELMNFALGVNWYLNSATRVMLEYVFSDLESDAGDIGNSNIVQMRFQIDF